LRQFLVGAIGVLQGWDCMRRARLLHQQSTILDLEMLV
jgi:hypothetical protein